MSDDIARMSFEQAMAALQAVVDEMEKPDTELEKAIALYERGKALREHCGAKLEAAQLKVRQITSDETGAATGMTTLDAK